MNPVRVARTRRHRGWRRRRCKARRPRRRRRPSTAVLTICPVCAGAVLAARTAVVAIIILLERAHVGADLRQRGRAGEERHAKEPRGWHFVWHAPAGSSHPHSRHDMWMDGSVTEKLQRRTSRALSNAPPHIRNRSSAPAEGPRVCKVCDRVTPPGLHRQTTPLFFL